MKTKRIGRDRVFLRAIIGVVFVLAACTGGILAGEACAAEDVYLALAPARFQAALTPLLAHRRAEGMQVIFTALEDLTPKGSSSPTAEAIRQAVRKTYLSTGKRLRYVLLAADGGPLQHEDAGPYIPPALLTPQFRSKTVPCPTILASDAWYGMLDDELTPRISVGRLPADSAEELALMVKKIVAYEKDGDFGIWRKTVNVVAGPGGFGPAADAMIENLFRRFVQDFLPPAYDLRMTYAHAVSPYFYPPSLFDGKVVDLLNKGSLFTAYVGHGSPFSFDRVRFRDRRFDIFTNRGAARVEVMHGAPIMVIIACSTGWFDHSRADCISEVLIKRPRGPVAVFSSTRISHPYSNGLIARGLLAHIASPRHLRLGPALDAVKRDLVSHKADAMNKTIDGFAGLFMKPKDLKPNREDHVHLYTLFGDPAAVLGLPREVLRVEAPASLTSQESFMVRCSADRVLTGSAIVTFEPLRGTLLRPLLSLDGLEGEPLRRRIMRNYESANRVTVVAARAKVGGASFEVVLTLPQDLAPGPYIVKAFASGQTFAAMGALRVEVKPVTEAAEDDGEDF